MKQRRKSFDKMKRKKKNHMIILKKLDTDLKTEQKMVDKMIKEAQIKGKKIKI
jgi:hypothetical protein